MERVRVCCGARTAQSIPVMSREIARRGDSWEDVGSVLAHLERQQLV